MRPIGDLGDGDRCPLVPEHGKMFVIEGKQWCANQWHDGVPGKEGRPKTRSHWPLHHLEAAVSVWRRLTGTTGELFDQTVEQETGELPELDLGFMPDLDITLEV